MAGLFTTTRVFALIALAALALPAPSASQTIAGRVRDVESRAPLRNLAVAVIGESGTVIMETRTDTAGEFYANLARPGRIHLRFRPASALVFDTDTFHVEAGDFVQREFIVSTERVFLGSEVERGVSTRRGSPMPRYPESLKQDGIEGEVLAEFVVDTMGRVRPETLRILRSTHPLLSQAIRTWLPRAVFEPARVGGRPVIQLVQLPYTFALR